MLTIPFDKPVLSHVEGPPVQFGNRGQQGDQPQPGLFKADVNWVTVAALFDQRNQISVCKKAGYKTGRQNPYLVGVDLQRRERQADGSYADWIDVPAYAPFILPPLPTVEIVK